MLLRALGSLSRLFNSKGILYQPKNIKFHRIGRQYIAYSADYRKAAIEYKWNEHTFKDLKDVFRITPCIYYQWVEILEKTGMTKSKIARTRRGKINHANLKKAVEEKPDLYLHELSEKFNCSMVAVHKRLVQLGFTYKKRHSSIPKNRSRQEQNL